MLDTASVLELLAGASAELAVNPEKSTIITAQLASKLASLVASATPPPSETSPVADPISLVNNILGDLKEGEKYFSKVQTFLGAVNDAKDESELLDLAMKELTGAGFTLDLKITSEGKEITMIKGSDIVSLGKSILSGNPLTSANLVTGVITNFEKSIFGFSVLETVKSFESVLDSLDQPSSADFKLGEITNTLDNVLAGMGGPRLTPVLSQLLDSVSTLTAAKAEADALIQKAKATFTQAVNEVIENPPELPEILPEPPEEDVSAPPLIPTDDDQTEQDEALESAKEQEEEEDFYYI